MFATGRQIIFSAGVYPVSVSGLIIPDGSYLHLNAGAELRALANSLSGKGVIDLTNKYQVAISGAGQISGDRNVHLSGGANHGVLIKGGANHTVQGVTITDSLDAIYVGKNSVAAQGITIQDVTATNSKRNGLSIVSASTGTVTDCAFIGTNGELPGAGVDLEPNAGETVSGWTFTRCTFSGNTGSGISADGTSGTLSNVSFIDCVVTDNDKQYAVNIDNANSLSINGGSIDGGSNMQVHVARSNGITVGGVTIAGDGVLETNGIYLDFDCDTVSIINNQISGVTAVGIQVNHVDDFDECTNVTVQGNTLDDVNIGIYFKASSTGCQSDNTVTNFVTDDILIDAGATVGACP